MKLTKIIIIAVLIVLLGYVGYRFRNITASDAAIREKFSCDRLTKEYLATDYYCQHPNAYRQGSGIPK